MPRQPPRKSSAEKHATAQRPKAWTIGAPNLAPGSSTPATRRKSKNVNVNAPRRHHERKGAERPPTNRERRTPMGGNTAKRNGAEDSHREDRAQESTPPHNGQKPGLSVRPTWLQSTKRPHRDAGQNVGLHKRRATVKGKVP